jgi:hypothetical protein
MQLREDDVARTNIGIHNQWRRPARVEIELLDHNGTLVTGHTREIPAQQTVQLNRPFYRLGDRSDIESGYAVVRVLSGQDIYVYGSVIDNATGDPTAIPMKSGVGTSRQWIAAAAHGGGVQGSVWRTDLTLLNRSGETAAAEIVFHRDNGDTASRVVDVSEGEQASIRDVVAEMGLSGSGALEIKANQPLLIASRTYNEGGAGTFGLFIDGIPDHRMADKGDTVWLPQLQQNNSFRTNLGLVNSGATRSRIRIALHDKTGAEISVIRKTLDPDGWLQIQRPYSKFAGRNDIEAGYARVDVESGGGVIAYASVIDNSTNDGTAITMKR